MRIKNNYNLKKYNTFNVNVSAKYYLECSSIKEIQNCILSSEFRNNEKIILGGGSNILFTKDFDGFVLKPNIKGIEVLQESQSEIVVRAYNGVVWDDFVKFCVNNNYYGAENLSWIPGVVGAVPIQNIGAYGAEAKEIIKKVSALEIESGNIIEFNNGQCEFDYRDSIFKKQLKDKYIIISVDFLLSKVENYNFEYQVLKEQLADKELNLNAVRSEIIKIRKSKLPNPKELGNGGSFFKNPVVNLDKWERIKNEFPNVPSFNIADDKYKIPAGWLIEQCGLKGIQHKNVGTYKKQALIIINYGNATGSEILKFSQFIKDKVEEKFSIILEEEIIII